MNTTLNTSTTTALNKSFYDRQLLESAKTRFVHTKFGQKRLSRFSATCLLKNDILDLTVSASQLINKYLLQRQRQHIYEKRLRRGQNVRHFLRRPAHYQLIQPPRDALVCEKSVTISRARISAPL